MSDFTPFFCDRAKGGRASCKGCRGNCPGGELRLAKVVASPYGENQLMKSWYHVDCFMNMLLKQRPTTKRIDSIDDIGNWSNLSKDDHEFLLKKINEMEKLYAEKNSGKYVAKVIKNESNIQNSLSISTSKAGESPSKAKENVDDDNFSSFCKLCIKISKVDAYTEKTSVVNEFFRKGLNGTFEGDLVLWCKFLLPQVSKRVYNLKSKQLVKLFSKIFAIDHDDMLTHLENGDVADTIQHYFTKSKSCKSASESTLTIHEVEDFLESLSKLTKEEEQIYHFKKIVKKCTADDIKMIIRLIKGDLRINAGPKHILEGVHPDAYHVFQSSRDLNMVIDKVLSQSSGVKHKDASQKTVEAEISLMTPILPMLAEACKSVEMAMKKCPNGMFSEIKYDGERVQVHKKGNEFKYFSRALKPVMAHKVSHFKDYLPQAFPKGKDLVLDAEVLMVDVETGKPLPFGTLGIHKQSAFKDAQVCLFVFDCLYYNGKVLLKLPIKKRRQILLENMVEVKNHVMFSEQQLIMKPSDLAKMIAEVLQLGLEGLVLKDLESTYEPGKRHWLKVKKDYLFGGAMADTADLVVLGAWFGSGRKGGMMSVFLMGCLDKRRNRWVTVTKVSGGHDDSTLDRLQKELAPLMVKISQENTKIPPWLDCNKGMVPDFVALDPKQQPVWEITGTEFTKANIHTADGISIRFPRVTRIRDDKNWETATNLDELKHLFKTSKEKTDVTLLNNLAATASKVDVSPTKKIIKTTPNKGTKMDDYLIKRDKQPTKRNSDGNSSNSSESTVNLSADEIESSSSKIPKTEKYIKKDLKQLTKRNNEINSSNSSESTINLSAGELEPSPSKVLKLEKEKTLRKRQRDLNSEPSSSETTIDGRTDDKEVEIGENEPSPSKRPKIEKQIKKEKMSKKRKRDLNSEPLSSETTIDGRTDDKEVEIGESESSPSKRPKIEKQIKKEKTSRKKKRDLDSEPSSPETTIDEKDVEKAIEYQFLPHNPLPDVFKDKKLGFYPDFISFTEDERFHFERHWIAYAGTVVKSIRVMDVDYVVHNKDTIALNDLRILRKKVPDHAVHVKKKWLIKCINKVKLCDTKKYRVFVDP